MTDVKTITPNPPANFTPELGNYKTLQPFRYWCQKVLPLVYDDSLSYYELLCKVVDYLNKTMEDVETLHGDVTNLHAAYEELQRYVNNYFSTLDVQEEINNKLDEMSKDGTLSNIIRPLILQTLPPYVVDSVEQMTDRNRTYILKSNGHIYQYNSSSGWFDTGLTYGESIGNVLEWIGLISGEVDFNDIAVQTIGILSDTDNPNKPTRDAGYIMTYGTHSGNIMQTFVAQTNGNTYYRFRIGSKKWGDWIDTIKNWVEWIGVIPEGTDFNNLSVQTIGVTTTGNYLNKPTTKTGFVFTYGTQTGNLVQLFYEQSTHDIYTRSRTGSASWTNWLSINSANVKWVGLISGDVDFNDIDVQTIGILSDTDNPNKPTRDAGYIMTYGTQSGNIMQTFVAQTNGDTYYRFRIGSKKWSDWNKVYPIPNTTNTYAHMYSIGNSILTGSVWLDGSYDHLAKYGNAPYSVIANSLQIPQDNVTHRLISSTGLLYDAGNGNFLTNIKQIDLKKYDCLLTHLWTADMNNTFPLGSVDSDAGDGTIAGAVIELCEYIKTSNSMCQLILVSVPPVSTTIYGDNVFTGAYPNGSTLNELNELMDALAEKYHFTFLKWNDLNISYYFHDYTDGLNVHANNEDTYRIMGAYLGGRASAKLNF